ncbi:MAG: GDSL-type esterase/lipase family protein [Byssovorax sp.]
MEARARDSSGEAADTTGSWLRRVVGGTRARRYGALLCATLLVCAGLGELVCQLYWRVVTRTLLAMQAEPNYVYQASPNPILGYELRRSYEVDLKGKRLHLNRYGLREDSDDLFADRTRVALLGDSVLFGLGVDNVSQEDTIPAIVQRKLDARGKKVKVLSFAVPGYGLPEMPELLRTMSAIYHPSRVVYVMNPNDFAKRGTRYEGSDSGLYRAYHPPTIKAPWFVRKLIYRMRKADDGVSPTVSWYRWTYEGTRDDDLPFLLEMKQFAEENRMRFGVTLLAVGAAYEGKPPGRSYALADMDRFVMRYCEDAKIPFADEVDVFADRPGAWDNTDHPTPEGEDLLADLLIDRFLADIE